jgi:hypothetical protein
MDKARIPYLTVHRSSGFGERILEAQEGQFVWTDLRGQHGSETDDHLPLSLPARASCLGSIMAYTGDMGEKDKQLVKSLRINSVNMDYVLDLPKAVYKEEYYSAEEYSAILEQLLYMYEGLKRFFLRNARQRMHNIKEIISCLKRKAKKSRQNHFTIHRRAKKLWRAHFTAGHPTINSE